MPLAPMTEKAANNVLRRKLAPSRAPAVPGESSVEAVLRITMPRDADRLLSLDLLVSGVSMATCDKPALIGRLQSGDLIYKLLGADEAAGICILSPGVLAALIEMQMSGRVSAAKPPERNPTRTDGIVAGEMVDRWMESAAETTAEEGLSGALNFAGYRRANGILDRRNAELTLNPGIFRTLAVEMSLGENAEKTGTLFFAAPEHSGRKPAPDATMSARLRGHLVGLQAPMRVVLARMPQPIGRIRALKPGDVIGVPLSALYSVRVEGMDGKLIDRGRLGQLNGQKAVRLSGASGRSEMAGSRTIAAEALESFKAHGALPPPASVPKLPETGIPAPGVVGENLPDLPDLPDFPEPSGLPDLEAS